MTEKQKNILCAVFVCFLLLVALFGLYQRSTGNHHAMLFGWAMATVETGSMEPNIPEGALIVIQEQDTYQVGDAVTYVHSSGQITITHRIISIEDGSVLTQGDANPSPDPEFPEDRIIGKVMLTIPYVGYVLMFLRNPLVLLLLFGAGALLFYVEAKREESELAYSQNEANE